MNEKNNLSNVEKGSTLLTRIIDGNGVNRNPLPEIPNSGMKVYGIDHSFFDTKEELERYCTVNDLSKDQMFTLDYIREVAGRKDVIKRTDKNGTSAFFTAVDEDGYGIFNATRSTYRGEFVWEFNYGTIEELYIPFRDRGVIFERDIYTEINERNKRLLKRCQEKNLFGLGGKNTGE